MRLRGLLALLLVLSAAPCAARCLAYEPAVVSLVGELVSKTLPGPPNYANIARGDIPEVVLILHLEEPVCVSGDPTSRLNSTSRAGISEVQLFVLPGKARALVGRRVRATGSLFGAHTGHHRTPVVLRVSALRLDGSAARGDDAVAAVPRLLSRGWLT